MRVIKIVKIFSIIFFITFTIAKIWFIHGWNFSISKTNPILHESDILWSEDGFQNKTIIHVREYCHYDFSITLYSNEHKNLGSENYKSQRLPIAFNGIIKNINLSHSSKTIRGSYPKLTSYNSNRFRFIIAGVSLDKGTYSIEYSLMPLNEDIHEMEGTITVHRNRYIKCPLGK